MIGTTLQLHWQPVFSDEEQASTQSAIAAQLGTDGPTYRWTIDSPHQAIGTTLTLSWESHVERSQQEDILQSIATAIDDPKVRFTWSLSESDPPSGLAPSGGEPVSPAVQDTGLGLTTGP